MSPQPRRWRLGLAAIVCTPVIVVGLAPAASAHPLGNATVNHYDGLTLYPDHVSDLAVEDIAEIPTIQRKGVIDTNGDGVLSAGERSSYAAAQCADLARTDAISINGRRVALDVTSSDYSERPGAIQLTIGRLVCQLQASAGLSSPSSVAISDQWDGDGIGWHEITAVGTGVALQNSPFPARTISGELLRYPNDLLSSPLDVRGGTVATTPGSGSSTYAAAKRLPVAGFALKALNRLATRFNALVGSKHVTVGVGLLAILLSMLLGAGHAFLPGHGKTIMAAYLVGRRGRLRDVITVGATVTITHTAGVLILGLLISVTTAFAPTAAEQVLGVVSGLIVAGVGVGLLASALRRRRTGRLDALLGGIADLTPAAEQASSQPVSASATPPVMSVRADGAASRSTTTVTPDRPALLTHVPATAAASHSGSTEHGHGHGPAHGHGHGHSHSHGAEQAGFSRAGLVGLGVAGGLVPSPSALLVLLAAVALGRTAFGIVVVLGYGLGMAAALSAAGLLLVRLRRYADRFAGPRLAKANRLLAVLPIFTASLVLIVGVWLTLRAAGGTV